MLGGSGQPNGNDERADGIMNPSKNGVRTVRASREALAVLSWEGASGHRSPFGRMDSGGRELMADAGHGTPWAGAGSVWQLRLGMDWA
jgi:hypothetical protein